MSSKVLRLIVTVIIFTMLHSLTEAHEGHGTIEKTNPVKDESIFNLKSEWVTQNGNSFSLKSLQGKPALVAMMYTSCEHACPLLVEDMKKIEKTLNEKAGMNIPLLIFSFDTLRDTPTKLKKFANSRKLDPAHWTLFHGSKSAVRDLAAVLGIRYRQSSNGDFDHSNVITLLDAEGLIEYQQVGLRQDPKLLLDKAFHLFP